MTHLIETTDGEIFEVTNLFDRHGCDTKELHKAVTIVIKFSDTEWGEAEILSRGVHRLQ